MKINLGEVVPEELAKFFLEKKGPFTPQELATEIRAIRKTLKVKDIPVKASHLYNMLKKVREVLEEDHKKTVVFSTSHGYELSTPETGTIYGMRVFKRWGKLTIRTRRIADVIDKRYIHKAKLEVFKRTRDMLTEIEALGTKLIEKENNTHEEGKGK